MKKLSEIYQLALEYFNKGNSRGICNCIDCIRIEESKITAEEWVEARNHFNNQRRLDLVPIEFQGATWNKGVFWWSIHERNLRIAYLNWLISHLKEQNL